jgi:hypothetical protein
MLLLCIGGFSAFCRSRDGDEPPFFPLAPALDLSSLSFSLTLSFSNDGSETPRRLKN